ncbi:MAG: NAD(P)-dependent oxidoreductase [Proteobacteria bacterium]|nr:MAG: NAD(P)-dependent oxidoreductase [Pseudomonadota bacterium]
MKTILITGASSGFGWEMAKLFAKNGYGIVAVARREDRLKKLKKKIKENILTIKLDVSDKKEVFKKLSNLPKPFDKVDILVNNAGFALGLDGANEAKLEDWEKMVDVNIKGLLYVTKALLPNMIKQKSGYIFNIGSTAGTWPYEGGNVYGATKSFVRQFSLNLRTDLKGTNIRVTNVEPGLAKTEFSLTRFKGDDKKAKNVYDGTKPLVAKDIANIIYFCASNPSHVNINTLEVMPTCQSFGGLSVEKLN